MANKFQLSVQERLLQESKQQKKIQREDIKPTPPPDRRELESAEVPGARTQDPQDMSLFLQPNNSRVAKNKTFYLDAEVIDALHTAAKKAHVTDSRLCNDILHKVLGLNK